VPKKAEFMRLQMHKKKNEKFNNTNKKMIISQ